MRGVYTAGIAISGLAAAKTLVYVTAPSTQCIEIIAARIYNRTIETNEQVDACLQRISSLGTPTATTITPWPQEPSDQAFAGTSKGNVTVSEPTYSSNTELGRQGFASLAGYNYLPTPEERPVITGAASIGLRLLSSPSSFDAWAEIVFRVIG